MTALRERPRATDGHGDSCQRRLDHTSAVPTAIAQPTAPLVATPAAAPPAATRHRCLGDRPFRHGSTAVVLRSAGCAGTRAFFNFDALVEASRASAFSTGAARSDAGRFFFALVFGVEAASERAMRAFSRSARVPAPMRRPRLGHRTYQTRALLPSAPSRDDPVACRRAIYIR